MLRWGIGNPVQPFDNPAHCIIWHANKHGDGKILKYMRQANRNTKQCQAERSRIAKLSEKLISQYKETKDERSQIHSWEWDNDFDLTILGLMDIYSSYSGGYASQIATRGTVQYPLLARELLQEKRFFDEPSGLKWFLKIGDWFLKIGDW
jgi:hypothetical protein